jgi:Tfp pilus assembly protein PilF
VCYYNQSDVRRAEQLFQLALHHDPNQPVALFNLGIVNERGGDAEAALKYFHRALEANSPEEMRQQIVQHMQQLLQKTGKTPPPLNPGAMPPGMPSGTPPGGTGK